MYNMEIALVDYINAQRKEAEEFSKQPGCWMGMIPAATETEYWNDRVPSGTLKEYNRIQLVEDAYLLRTMSARLTLRRLSFGQM